jgi:hypothetical protein
MPRSKLTDEVEAKLVAAFQRGASNRAAAAHAGIPIPTLETWLKKGAQAKSGRYAEFMAGVTRARNAGEVALLESIRFAAEPRKRLTTYKNGRTVEETVPGDWRAAAFLLAVRDPDRYSEKRRLEHSGTIGKPNADRERDEALALLANPQIRRVLDEERRRELAPPSAGEGGEASDAGSNGNGSHVGNGRTVASGPASRLPLE